MHGTCQGPVAGVGLAGVSSYRQPSGWSRVSEEEGGGCSGCRERGWRVTEGLTGKRQGSAFPSECEGSLWGLLSRGGAQPDFAFKVHPSAARWRVG